MSIKKTIALARNFREREPRKVRRANFSSPEGKLVAIMGTVDAISYTTTHGTKAARYKHTFAKGSKPMLCAGPGNKQLYLIGGRYRVTARGIVDLSPRGREIDDGRRR